MYTAATIHRLDIFITTESYQKYVKIIHNSFAFTTLDFSDRTIDNKHVSLARTREQQHFRLRP